jgi:hypothetical protein
MGVAAAGVIHGPEVESVIRKLARDTIRAKIRSIGRRLPTTKQILPGHVIEKFRKSFLLALLAAACISCIAKIL